jgi:hypothetical protein
MVSRTAPAWLFFVVLIAAAVGACDDDDAGPTATPTSPPAATAAATGTPPPTEPPPPVAIDPCTLRDSLDGRSLVPGPAFVLSEAIAWQLCIGGAAAGSSEKYLYRTDAGGADWTLVSMTTLGNPPPEPGVGELPNGNAAEALFFSDELNGWLGLSSPGANLFRSGDGGITWTEVPGLPSGLPVTAIDFTDANNGAATTPDGDWTTSDGGASWEPPP